MFLKRAGLSLFFPLVVALGGCTTALAPLSEHITRAPPGNFQLIEAARDPDASIGRVVRWGGEVLQTHAAEDGGTEVIVLERSLSEDGRPRIGGPSDGRFLVRATAQTDPELYRIGTYVTVAGSVIGDTVPSAAATTEPLPLVRVTDIENWGYAWAGSPGYFDPWPHYPFRHSHPPHIRFGLGIHRGLHWRHRYPYHW